MRSIINKKNGGIVNPRDHIGLLGKILTMIPFIGS